MAHYHRSHATDKYSNTSLGYDNGGAGYGCWCFSDAQSVTLIIESHRSRVHGGYGLGLSIVKSIVETHDGIIEVKSDPMQGTTFLIYIPREN